MAQNARKYSRACLASSHLIRSTHSLPFRRVTKCKPSIVGGCWNTSPPLKLLCFIDFAIVLAPQMMPPGRRRDELKNHKRPHNSGPSMSRSNWNASVNRQPIVVAGFQGMPLRDISLPDDVQGHPSRVSLDVCGKGGVAGHNRIQPL